MDQKFPEVEVQLTGQDGNVFFIIGKVAKALKRANLDASAKEFSDTAMKCGSYDEVLWLCMSTVTVL